MFLDLTQPKHAHVQQRLQSEPIIWLSSVRPDGRPHLVPVWFLWDGERIIIFSQPHAQKMRNLRANPAVTLALEAADGGNDVAIIEGVAELGETADAGPVLPDYEAKYRQAIAALGTDLEAMAADYTKMIRVTPRRLLAW